MTTEPLKRRKFWPIVIRVVVALALFAWLGTHLDWNQCPNGQRAALA